MDKLGLVNHEENMVQSPPNQFKSRGWLPRGELSPQEPTL